MWILGIVVVAGLALAVDLIRTGRLTPEPYEYNARTNQYWDPDHQHWHDGQPPEGSATALADGAETPEPWEYDGIEDRYWHPDHGHWHDGPPPADALAESALP